ncbi:MAG TPA: murein biosynthesis integral membrane protein MurJ [Kofleriaceae bacterium]
MPATEPPRRGGGALAVGAGIFLSRIAGLVRERVLAHYLGLSVARDAFNAALKIPNFLQNLFGEGVLSASLIPVYARLRAEGRDDDASRVARTIGTLLALLASVIALAGVFAARPLVELLLPGFTAEQSELTITLVRVLFPGTSLLVMSAWCLGVLNSHRRFFLSYVSPVLWNVALIIAAIIAGQRGDDDIALWVAWGAVIGSAAQLGIQLPTTIALLRSARPSLAVRDSGVRTTLRAFVPVLLGRGSVQISAFIDQVLASFLQGTYAAIGAAQTLYLLPVSLFGMAVSAAELPEMSSATGDDQARGEQLRTRLRSSLRRVVFLVVPSAIAFVMIGDSIVALLFQTGRFTKDDTELVWLILTGSAIGLVPATQGRLLGSAFYALHDTKRPLYAALVRVTISAVLGYLFALPLRGHFGYSAAWGAFALTASSAFAGWIEFGLLFRWLGKRIGGVPLPVRLLFGSLAAAVLAGAAGFAAGYFTHRYVAIPVFGVVYLGIMAVARVPETQAITRRILRRRA